MTATPDQPPQQDRPSLGDLPEPTVEPPELVPGGPDAVGHPDRHPVAADLAPEHDPAAGAAPAETRTGEDTSTRATESSDGASDVDPAEESPA